MEITRDVISQAAIFIFGVAGIILVARKNKRWFVFWLASQPFWYITSYINWQRGIFFVSIVYTVSWCYGIYEWFWKNKKVSDDKKS